MFNKNNQYIKSSCLIVIGFLCLMLMAHFATAEAASWPVLRRGDSGTNVKALQYLLTSHGHSTTVDGDFGSGTKRNVQAFQRSNGLTDDGIVGTNTWQSIVKTVRQNSRDGDAVRAVQLILNEKCRAGLTVDGLFGGQTDDAVRDFQSAVNITSDGIVGKTTWRYLLAQTGRCTASNPPPSDPNPTSYTVDSDLTIVPDITGDEIDNAIAAVSPGSPLIGLGDTIVEVGRERGVNPLYITAHAAWESAWGRSSIAREKNNLFGYRAFDSCPSTCAKSYASKDASVREVIPIVDRNYLTEGGQYYTSHGPTLRGMNVYYATDKNWKNGIASIMNSLNRNIP